MNKILNEVPVPKEELVAIQQKKELKLLGRIKPKKGHRLFKLKNGKIEEVKEEDFLECVAFLSGRRVKKLKVEKGCQYVSALNKKNAAKRLRREGIKVEHL